MNTLSLELAHSPATRAAWAGKLVYIWSHEHGAYWRVNASGYTTRITNGVGVFDFQDAYNRTKHCGLEKGIEFEEVQK